MAPSNSGNVQISAVAVSRSDATSHTCDNRECVTGLGRTDMNLAWLSYAAAMGSSLWCSDETTRSRRTGVR